MLTTVVATVLGFSVLFGLMSLGVIFANKPIKGSCGGMSALGFKEGCDVCGGKPSACDAQQGEAKAVPLSYNAMDNRNE